MEVIRQPSLQGHRRGQALVLEVSLDVVQRPGRQVGAHVRLALRGDAEEQQPRSAANLQNASRPIELDPLDRSFHPLPHLLRRYGLTGVAAVPAVRVERRVLRGVHPGVHLAPQRLPLIDVLAFLPCHRGLLRDEVRHQTPVFVLALPEGDHRLADPVERRELRLDFAQFDPVSPKLDLMIQATEQLDAPVRLIPSKIAGAVETRPRDLPERIGHESFRRELRSREVAARHARSTDVQLARNARRHGLDRSIDNVHLLVGKRPTDRLRPVPLPQHARRVGRRLRWTVQIEDALHPRCVDLVDQLPSQRLTRQVHRLHRRRKRPLPQQCCDRRRNGVDQPDLILARQLRKRQCVFCQDHRSAPTQRTEEFEDREVEADRR